MNQLIRLVYASRSVSTPGAAHQGLDPTIARILAKSRKNNARLDVVGGLLFGQGYYLQCLEGDARIVQNLYSKIETDTRHRDVTVLLQSSIRTRTFDAWSMKYVPGEQRLQGLMRQWGVTQFDPYQLTRDQIEAAVRFMRDAEDAVDTEPGELQAPFSAAAEEKLSTGPASHREVLARAKANKPAAPGGGRFAKAILGVALIGLAALAFLMLR